MSSVREDRRVRLRHAGLVLLLIASTGCRPELVVRFATEVYRDGSVSRLLDLRGTPDPTEPEPEKLEDGLLSFGAALADPEAWERVEEGPGWIRAEGFFLGVDDLPALLAFEADEELREARFRTELDFDDHVVLARWIYSETHGDPYSSADCARGLDALVGIAVETLRAELRSQFGPEIDTLGAEEFLRGEARALAWAMITAGRGSPGLERIEERGDRWTQLLQQHGLPVVEGGDRTDFWGTQTPVLLDWLRGKVAAALSTGEQRIAPAELTFWPMGEEWEEQLTVIIDRVWGGEDELYEILEPHLSAMAGYYGADNAPRVRFESRVRMPGVLLRTNGTPDGDSVVWTFRQQELTLGDLVLRAESVEPQAGVLTDVGARREFDRASLLRLADILWTQDPEGRLVPLLRTVVKQGKLAVLRDKNAVPDDLLPLARELADLLDPEVPLPAPL